VLRLHASGAAVGLLGLAQGAGPQRAAGRLTAAALGLLMLVRQLRKRRGKALRILWLRQRLLVQLLLARRCRAAARRLLVQLQRQLRRRRPCRWRRLRCRVRRLLELLPC
jgi:hypothetical protein